MAGWPCCAVPKAHAILGAWQQFFSIMELQEIIISYPKTLRAVTKLGVPWHFLLPHGVTVASIWCAERKHEDESWTLYTCLQSVPKNACPLYEKWERVSVCSPKHHWQLHMPRRGNLSLHTATALPPHLEHILFPTNRAVLNSLSLILN